MISRYLYFYLPSLSLHFLPFPFTPFFPFPFTYKYTHPILISILTFLPICAAAPFFPSLSFLLSPFPLYISIPTFCLPFPFSLLISIYTYLPVSPSRFILFSLSFRRFHRLKSSGKQNASRRFHQKNGVGASPYTEILSPFIYKYTYIYTYINTYKYIYKFTYI